MADSDSIATPSRVKDITRQTFGKLTVLAFSEIRPKLGAYWTCVCECGRETVHRGADLRKGYIVSCGCHKAEQARNALTTHGLSKLPMFRRWCGIIQRCCDPNHVAYARYGGKGIAVCERWKSFENFYADMGEPPSDKHSVERIDGSLGYSPGNCCWATASEQNRNTSQNRIITFCGQTKCLADWAMELGINYGTLQSRIGKYGWTVERAFTTPLR